jgi:carbamate kinase
MIGYLLETEMRGAMRRTENLTTVLTVSEVAADDPAFAHPTKFVGPQYDDHEAHELERRMGWHFARDGRRLRRVVASPEPVWVMAVDSCEALLAAGHVVIAAGGGGIPVTRDASGRMYGVEAVLDKDLSSAVLAMGLDAGLLVLATDAPAVSLGWGTPEERGLRRIGAPDLAALSFAPGSMGPKVTAACRFVGATGHRAVIGSLADLPGLLAGTAGTTVVAGRPAVKFWEA